MVLSEEGATALEGASRSLILMDMPPPILVVEVVSPQQEKRDYRYKRSEYAARGIAEYWIIDPIQQCLTVLEWVEGFYEEQVYRGDDKLNSPILNQLIAAGIGAGDSFPEVPELTVAQVLRGQ